MNTKNFPKRYQTERGEEDEEEQNYFFTPSNRDVMMMKQKNNFDSLTKTEKPKSLLLLVCDCFPSALLVYRLSNPL